MDRASRSSETAPAIDTEPAPRHEEHLQRSRTVWDRWSDHYGLSESDFEPYREDAIDRLDLQAGDRVLEVGCGPGVNLERLRADVGEAGEIVAVDYSPEMVEKARDRVEAHGWENVTVRRADATTATFDGEFDAALATLSLSVMPDVREATANVHRALAPGGSFVVLDLGPVQTGPARIVNPLLWRFLYWYANWNPEGDVVESLTAVFDEADVLETYVAGACYVVRCRKRPRAREDS